VNNASGRAVLIFVKHENTASLSIPFNKQIVDGWLLTMCLSQVFGGIFWPITRDCAIDWQKCSKVATVEIILILKVICGSRCGKLSVG
jgi:hypothetical protein